MTRQRVTVAEAAQLLGTSQDAVRMRLKRGKLEGNKRGNKLYVWVNTDQTTDQTTPRDGLLEVYRERVAFLERELERKDAILLNMTEAMKAISPLAHEEPSAPPESPETATVEETEHHPGGVQEGAQRPWWRRLFGG